VLSESDSVGSKVTWEAREVQVRVWWVVLEVVRRTAIYRGRSAPR